MIQDKINICFLEDHVSLKDALIDCFHLSRQQIKKYLPKSQQNLKIELKKNYELPINLINHLLINPSYQNDYIKTIYESDDLIAFNKPSGVHSTTLLYSDSNSLQAFLRQEKPDLLLINPKEYERGLINRLDEETSGVVLYAKNNKTHRFLREEFHQVAKTKKYLAIVKGDFDRSGEHTHYISSTGPKGHKKKVCDSGEKAEIYIEKLSYLQNKNLSLLSIDLKQGIRHQIRVQLYALGFPILGDTLYGGEDYSRLMLHSWKYELSFQNNLIEIIADPNAEFLLFAPFFQNA